MNTRSGAFDDATTRAERKYAQRDARKQPKMKVQAGAKKLQRLLKEKNK